MTTAEILKKAKNAKKAMSLITSEEKCAALLKMADFLEKNESEILNANKIDLEKAAESISEVMQDRLRLSPERIAAMAQGIREVAALDDPTGKVLEKTVRPNGLVIEKTSVPLGVVAIIYESRPNVTSDAAALCFKSGNVCILRGGKEAYNTSAAVVKALKKALAECSLNEDCINLIEDTSRESAKELMTANGYIDMLIPRGGAGLINACVMNATVPCIQTGTGICHIYVDDSANLDTALKIIENAKTSRPSVCNAEEVLLVHKKVAESFLPRLKKQLTDIQTEKGKPAVELRLDEKAAKFTEGKAAGEKDFDTEFLDYILAVKVVDSLDEAIEHIAAHSTGHSEAIITENSENAEKFLSLVDSAAVYVNASTRFTDGGEFGLGCEMGISTQKLHARGPMGLRELTAYKYKIYGNGQVR
ncbi:MAG: glutamate-5-semialdehyde dehydrogenase [Ruminococcaceae bacterium]|nr:glutamate-5-semialdehyde dehydrogenase [Oscillospiraceae bacterium]